MSAIAISQRMNGFPLRRTWTYTEFENAWKQGVFRPEERLELIEGEIVEKMSQDSEHSAGIGACEEALKLAFPVGHWVRIQMPLLVSEASAPETDLAVVPGSWRDYRGGHPTKAVMVIEVAESSLAYDRSTKTGLYALAEVEEYWILNLVDRVLEVYRDPGVVAGTPLGHAYRSVVQFTDGQTVSPLAAPKAILSVADLLP